MIITKTPFRISFFGGGTDYPAWFTENEGRVLAATIDKYCYITCRTLPPFFEHDIRVGWSQIENISDVDEIVHPAVREGLRFMGTQRGISITHEGDLPARTGLGSSSSFMVGLLGALYAHNGRVAFRRCFDPEQLRGTHGSAHCLREGQGEEKKVDCFPLH